MDVFLYNGDLSRGADLRFVEFVSKNKQHDELLLILVTPGGSPDAAYKIGRYIQSKYSAVKVYVPGFCKSAGTLLAIAASELIFSPYGELGPLDIQMSRTDNLTGLDSGLNISEAFLALEGRAMETFHRLVRDIIGSTGGIVSFHTASHSASEIVSSLYGPIFARIDPEEVGSRARAMRIGEDYGNRLNQKFANMKANSLTLLSQTYSSHGFVIDMQEAAALFERVREASVAEKALVDELGNICRIPGDRLEIVNLSDRYHEHAAQEESDDPADQTSDDADQLRVKRTRASRKPAEESYGANGKDTAGTGAA